MKMSRTFPGIAAGLTAALLGLSIDARADGAADVAAAQALFDQGKALLEAGKLSEACPKLAQSQKLDPGGGTLVHLGSCYEQEGKLASAWAVLREAADIARRDKRGDREQFAKKRLEIITPRLAHLTISVAPAAAELPGLVVKRDGEPVDKAIWGTSLPIDRGAHELSASAPGFVTWTERVSVPDDGASVTIHVPGLAHVENGPGAHDEAGGTWHKPAAIAALSAGGAGLVLGAVFGVLAKTKHDDASALCTLGPEKNGCPQEAVDREDSARSAGTISTIAFAAGGAMAAAGLVIWLVKPPDQAAPPRAALAPVLAPGRAGLSLEGRF